MTGDPPAPSARISDCLIDRNDPAEDNVEKLLVIIDSLMRHAEQNQGDRSAAFEEFRRAAVLEDRVRLRTRDLEITLRLLNKANSDAELARRNLSQAIEAIEEGFALFDVDDRLVMSNSRFCRDLADIAPLIHPGMSFAEYIQTTSRSRHLSLPSPMQPQDWVADRMARHHLGQVFNAGLTGDRWLQISEQHTADGGTVVMQTNITDTIRAERNERGKLLDDQARIIRATLEHINQGVAIFDSSRRLVGCNWRLAQLLDIPVGALQSGISFASLVGRASRYLNFGGDFTTRMLLAWVRGESPRMPLSFELGHASGVVLDVFAQDMPGHGFVMSFTDVTRERMAVQAMLRANTTLEARVTARTEELAEALADARRANSARVRFVAAASHDLLQPLSAAKLFVAGARDDALDPKLNNTLVKAHNALTSVEHILGALLDISRLESGGSEVEITPVPLSLLLEQLKDEFAALAARKGLRLDILPCNMVVLSDATYLRRILQNLISNAIRYTASGRILVGARRISGGVRIEVHDTGPGIGPDDQAAIFREFHRINSSASAAEGMGLGLAIVERACTLLDHRLALRSTVGRGTCFSVDLPQARGHSRPDPRKAPPNIPSEPGENVDCIALLVENDDELRRAMSLLLERRGVNVLEAASGELALELLDEIGIAPDLYLIDHQLGDGMTGVETAQALHQRHGQRPTRIITANRDPQTRAAARNAGLQIMLKPIDLDQLEDFVRNAGSSPDSG